MPQQKVQIVKRRWILVFESIEQSLLNHSELDCPLLQLFSEGAWFVADVEVIVKVFEQVIEGQQLINLQYFVYFLGCVLLFEAAHHLINNNPLLSQIIRHHFYFLFVLRHKNANNSSTMWLKWHISSLFEWFIGVWLKNQHFLKDIRKLGQEEAIS